MKLYNTMSREIEELKPQDPTLVKLYTCGPTVYDYMHIGNWASFIRWDILVRALQATGHKVNWVMNITDVGHLTSDADEGEDKLEKGAEREGKTAWEIADFYTDDFKQGMRELNISLPFDHLFRATDFINQQIELIKTLKQKGFTYVIDDGVYFDTAKLDDYGKLARLKLDELKAGARVAVNEQKRSPTDFALWKFSPKDKKRDMEWDSPWGKGFPGWHLECSAIAMDRLGDTLDIHAGGIDHIPVHHTNEIAQSESATEKSFSNLWLHSNFLLINGQKMSKSLGNWFNLHDIDKKGFSALDFRMLVLQSHYQTEANFTWDSLDSAKNRLKGLQAMADLRFQVIDHDGIDGQDLSETKQKIIEALEDNLNTPEALAALSSLEAKLVGNSIKDEFNQFIIWLDEVLGLKLSTSADITNEQKSIIQKREAAREAKDWQMSDKLRIELQEQGIEVSDTDHGTIWSRT